MPAQTAQSFPCAIAAISILCSACLPKHAPPKEATAAFPSLAKVAPECEHARPHQVDACREAERLMGMPPRQASIEFIAFWNDAGTAEQRRRHVAETGARNQKKLQESEIRPGDVRRNGLLDWSGLPEAWNRAIGVAEVGNAIGTLPADLAEGQFEEDGIILLPVIRWVYEHGPDAYSADMQAASERIEWASHTSFVAFANAHLAAARPSRK